MAILRHITAGSQLAHDLLTIFPRYALSNHEQPPLVFLCREVISYRQKCC
jgi:hypothetical protein